MTENREKIKTFLKDFAYPNKRFLPIHMPKKFCFKTALRLFLIFILFLGAFFLYNQKISKIRDE